MVETTAPRKGLVRLLSPLAAFALVPLITVCDEDPGPPTAEDTAALCSDGIDNDDDLAVDCRDTDCQLAGFCEADGDADSDADTDANALQDGDLDSDLDADTPTDAESMTDVESAPDAEMLADADGPDGEIPTDADTLDDGDAADAGADAEADAEEEIDPCDLPWPCVDDDECPDPTLACYDYNLDGELICAPRGGLCVTSDTCPGAVTCGALPCWYRAGSYCHVESDTCATSADCGDGFACEDTHCVDRRRPCVTGDDCPWWHGCLPLLSGERACQPLPAETCTEAWECPGPIFECVDIEGDGDNECQMSVGGTCITNADCVESVCGDSDLDGATECGLIGPCLTDDDCPTTHECADVNADGDSECQVSGGACVLDADCPPAQICFDSDGSGGAACS